MIMIKLKHQMCMGPLYLYLCFKQEKSKCDLKGRDCIEKNFARTFSCNTTCEGTYADVQKIGNEMEDLEEREPDEYLKEEFGSIEEETLYKKLYKKMTNDIEMKMGKSSSIGEKVDKMKFKGLVSEYRSFKRNRVQHFRFNSASNQTAFGELQIGQRLY